MYPVVLYQELLEMWLTPEQYHGQNLRNAWRVGPGMRLLTRTIERNIRESDEETRRKKFEEMWHCGSGRDGEPWTEEDEEVYRTLLKEYESDSTPQGGL